MERDHRIRETFQMHGGQMTIANLVELCLEDGILPRGGTQTVSERACVRALSYPHVTASPTRGDEISGEEKELYRGIREVFAAEGGEMTLRRLVRACRSKSLFLPPDANADAALVCREALQALGDDGLPFAIQKAEKPDTWVIRERATLEDYRAALLSLVAQAQAQRNALDELRQEQTARFGHA